MNNSKRIDGKNAVLNIEGNNICIIYKNAFGELSTKSTKRFEFTFEDLEDIEFKKPGISMNGFLFFALKNGDLHKVVLSKLDEYSLEITDEFVKNVNSVIKPVIEPDEEEKKDEEEKEPVTIINNDVFAIFPQKLKNEDEKEEDKKKIVVTDKAVNIANKDVKIIKPKSKEEIEKDKIREELKRKIEEKKKLEQNNIEEPIIVPPIKQNDSIIKDKPKHIPTPIEEEPKEVEKQEVKEVQIIDDNEYGIDNKKEEEKKIEEKKKEKDNIIPNIFKKLNITIKKDKTKTDEFAKESSKKILVGTVETNEKGEDKSVPIEVAVRPLKKEELEELEKKKNDVIIDELKYKLYVIESELASLNYELMVLQKYADTTYDREEIQRILKQIEDLIKILEAIKKEIIAKMEGKDYVANQALDVTGDNIVNIDDFKTIYVKAIDKINEFEVELENIKDKTNERKKEIELTDKEYEKDCKTLKERQDIIKYYDDFIARTLNYTYNINRVVGKTFEVQNNTYIRNVYELRNDTRALIALSAASLAIPGVNGPTTAILATTAGITAMRDAIIPTRTEEHRQVRVIPTDYSTEISKNIRNTNEAAKYLKDAREDISDIKKEITEKYKNYPEYDDIIEEFDKLEVELDRQEKQLNYALYMVKNQMMVNNNQKVLILENDNV
jgi:hypothetical protein